MNSSEEEEKNKKPTIKATIQTIILIIICFIALTYLFNFCASIYLTGILLVHFIARHICNEEQEETFEEFLHRPVIKLPNQLKCLINVNKTEKGYCYNEKAENFRSSQQNADIDGFAICHFGNYMIFGLLFGSDIPVWKIILISLIWEGSEHLVDVARWTDPIINTLGFIFGKYLRLLIYPKPFGGVCKPRNIKKDIKYLKKRFKFYK